MEKVLAVHGLHKRFGSGSRLVRANDGITMDVKAGEVVGVLGHNGAGKTTLVNQVVGLYRPHSGSIAVGGVDVVAEPELARRLVSVQAQANVPITGISPRKAIELTGRIRGGRRRAMRARASELIDVLDMGEWADKLAEKVSGGVARLAAFAMAVAQPGALVVLDEPTNDVDPVRRRLLWDQIRVLADDGAAVLLVTHNVREAERAVDRLVILERGRVIARGAPDDLVASRPYPIVLELTARPGTALDPPPGLSVERSERTRTVLGVPADRATDAIAWASRLREDGVIERYSLEPVSLEEVYVGLAADGSGREARPS